MSIACIPLRPLRRGLIVGISLMQDSACREAVADQEADRIGNIIGPSNASGRQAPCHRIKRCLLGVAGDEAPDRRVHPSGRHRVDPYRRQFDSKRPDQAFERRIDGCDHRSTRRRSVGRDT